MEIIFWIILCMLGYIAAIEIFGRIYYGVKPLKYITKEFVTVPLASGHTQMREQMEYYISWLEWNGCGRTVLLVCDDDNKAAEEMFGQCFSGFSGIELCSTEKLAERFKQNIEG